MAPRHNLPIVLDYGDGRPVRSVTRTTHGPFHNCRAFQRFAAQVGDPALKFLCELLLPAAERICPRFDCVFVNGLIVEGAHAAPPIVINKRHRRFPPRTLANNTPLQNRRNHVVAILENVGFYNQIFAHDPLDRGTSAIN